MEDPTYILEFLYFEGKYSGGLEIGLKKRYTALLEYNIMQNDQGCLIS